MTLLACVLECSSIGAMIFLSIFVASTRIGVNKDLEDDKPEDKEATESETAAPSTNQPAFDPHSGNSDPPTSS